MSARWIALMLMLGSTVVLARILSPRDFGTVALLNLLSGFFVIAGTAGLSAAVVQFRELNRKDIQRLFGLSIGIATACALLLVVLSHIISAASTDFDFTALGYFAATTVFFSICNAVPNGLLLRDGRMGAVGVRQLIGTGVGVGMAVASANLGVGAVSLLLVPMMTSIIPFLGNANEVRIRPSIHGLNQSVRAIRSYSVYDYLSSVTRYASRSVDGVLAGALMGPAALGVYNQALVLSNYPVANISSILNPMLHPVLAAKQRQRNLVLQQYAEVVRVLSSIGLVVSAVGVAAAPEIIYAVLGRQWTGSIAPFQILCLGIWFQMCVTSAGPVFQSVGATRSMFRSGLVISLVAFVAAGVGAFSGEVVILAAFVSLGAIFKFFYEYRCLLRDGFGVSVFWLFRQLRMHLIVGAVSFVAAGFSWFFVDSSGILLSLMLKVLCIAVSWILSLCLVGEMRKIVVFVRGV